MTLRVHFHIYILFANTAPSLNWFLTLLIRGNVLLSLHFSLVLPLIGQNSDEKRLIYPAEKEL